MEADPPFEGWGIGSAEGGVWPGEKTPFLGGREMGFFGLGLFIYFK
jgi:hypothetical protein